MIWKVGLNVYGKAWLIEPNAASNYLSLLDGLKSGPETWQETKPKSSLSLFQNNGIIVAPTSSYGMDEFIKAGSFEDCETAIISLSGPLMKSDFCGDLGTDSIRQLVSMASNSAKVRNIVFAIDSPGGTVDGTEILAAEIRNTNKRTIAYVSGSMCSAAYWIGSNCDEVYASSQTDMIGSIGTMCSLVDNSEAMKERGVVIREYYATESEDKNKAYTEAKSGNGKLLISEVLDPINNVFLTSVKDSRPFVKEDALSGKVYLANDAIAMGLIDGIKTFSEIISTQKPVYKNSVMTIEQLRAEHGDVYAAITASAIEAERDRVGAWMAYVDVDAKAVKEGVASGKNITQTAMVELTRKQFSNEMLNKAEADSAATPAATTPQTADVPVGTPQENPNELNASSKAEIEAAIKALGIK